MSLINNRNEESTPEFEVISGGKEDVRSSFADRTCLLYTSGNTKILYFLNCLLDGMHTIGSPLGRLF